MFMLVLISSNALDQYMKKQRVCSMFITIKTPSMNVFDCRYVSNKLYCGACSCQSLITMNDETDNVQIRVQTIKAGHDE